VKAFVDAIFLKAALPAFERLRQGIALIRGEVAHERSLGHEAAQFDKELVQMFVGAKRMLQPIVDEFVRNRLEDSECIAAISDLKKRDGLFDEPLLFLHVAGRPIAVPIALVALALGEQIACVLTDRLGIDSGPSPTSFLVAR